MTRFRGISLSAHSLAEMVTGLALLVAAFTLDAGTPGILALFGAGVVLAGMGLGSTDSLPLGAHASLDRWLTTALAVTSILLALAGERAPALVLLATATALLLLVSLTHWSRPVAAR